MEHIFLLIKIRKICFQILPNVLFKNIHIHSLNLLNFVLIVVFDVEAAPETVRELHFLPFNYVSGRIENFLVFYIKENVICDSSKSCKFFSIYCCWYFKKAWLFGLLSKLCHIDVLLHVYASSHASNVFGILTITHQKPMWISRSKQPFAYLDYILNNN